MKTILEYVINQKIKPEIDLVKIFKRFYDNKIVSTKTIGSNANIITCGVFDEDIQATINIFPDKLEAVYTNNITKCINSYEALEAMQNEFHTKNENIKELNCNVIFVITFANSDTEINKTIYNVFNKHASFTNMSGETLVSIFNNNESTEKYANNRITDYNDIVNCLKEINKLNIR